MYEIMVISWNHDYTHRHMSSVEKCSDDTPLKKRDKDLQCENPKPLLLRNVFPCEWVRKNETIINCPMPW